ncbi:IS1380 family transposase [Fodinisporobacter ferrooxydans]|uniref:IS1380 family transposase n=1 Tax=Fodinisporobacter ferrooxydans TaxID=2901836 RepID=A0ABY4CQV9_9BACL|nr:IS1380 family transposase [Alicyclobacillaceae bacterium MYW30-H2]
MPVHFEFEQSNEYLTSHSGLAAIGQLIAQTRLTQRLDHTKLDGVRSPDISNGDIMSSYLGLLCQGKNDFDAIEPFREDDFFALSLDLKLVPSSPTLRQRLDMAGASEDADWQTILKEESATLLKTINVPLTPIMIRLPDGTEQQFLPLDVDVSPFDNSKTKKEGTSRTYKAFDGYAPIFAYLAREGYNMNVELREGKQHCQNGTPAFLSQSIHYARMITEQPLLVRLDSGNDSKDNLVVCHAEETKADYIIKRNLRKESREEWLTVAQTKGICCEQREGKKVYIGSTSLYVKEMQQSVRVVFQVTERTITKDGQVLFVPEIEVDTYWTSLTCSAWQVIELYHDHGTSEQFHSEIKTDLDMERLPAGKFKTNDVILHAGVFAYNLLRIIGQQSLQTPFSPLKKSVQRRRIRTVIQNMIYLAARLVRHARKWKLRFGCYCPWFHTVKQMYTTASL